MSEPLKKKGPSIQPSRKWKKATELPDKVLIRKLFPKQVVDEMNRAGAIEDDAPDSTEKDNS